MMKGNKAIKTLTAVSMTATSLLSSTPVMAQNVAVGENVTDNKQNKEQVFRESLDKAREQQKDKEDILNNSEKQLKEAESKEATAELARKQQELETLQMQQKISNELLNELEKRETAFNTVYTEVKTLEKEIENDKTELNNKVADLVVKEQELDKAKKDLKAAREAAAVATPEAVKNAEADLKVKQKEYNQKKAELENAIAEKAKAEADVKEKEDLLAQKEKEKNLAQENVNTAQNNYDIASENQKEAQSVYDATQDPELKQKAQKELEDAAKELKVAENELKAANSKLEQARTNESNCQKTYDNSVKKQTEIENQIAKLEEEKATLEIEHKKVTDQYNKVVAENKDWKDKKAILDSEILTLENTIKEKNEELSTLKETKKSYEETILKQENQLKALEQTLKDEDAAITERINQGSLRFFEMMGDQEAAELIKRGISEGYTYLGDKYDATTLDNMQKALDQLKTGNAIRKSLGLPEWKISHRLMAIAQIHANESQQIMDHTHKDNVSENLAWGYVDPYEGWYTAEKNYLDQVVAENPTYAQMRAEGKSDAELIDYIRRHDVDTWLEVGHYGNVITEEYLVAGAGYTGRREGSGKNKWNWDCSAWVGFFAGEQSYSIEDYQSMFTQYTNDVLVKPHQAEYDQLKKDLATNKLALEKVKKDISDINGQISNTQGEKDKKEFERETVVSNITSTDTQIDRLNKNTKDLNDKLSSYDVKLKEQNSNLLNQKEIVATNKENLDKAKVTLAEADKLEHEKGRIYDQKLSIHAEKQDKVDEIAKGEKEAKEKLDFANAKQKETLDILNKNQNTLKASQKDLETAKLNLETAKSDNSQKLLDLQNATQAEENSKLDLNAAKELVDKYNTLLSNQEISKQKVISIEKEIEDNKASQKQLTQNIEVNSTKYRNDVEILSGLKVSLDQVKNAQKIWNRVLVGGEDSLEIVSESLKPIAEDIETYKSLRTVLKEKTEKVNELKASTELKRSEYIKAKKEYNEAKAIAEKIEKDLALYIAEQKKQEEIKKAEEEKKKKDSVETGIAFDLGFYQSLTAIAAAGFTVSLIKSKRKN